MKAKTCKYYQPKDPDRKTICQNCMYADKKKGECKIARVLGVRE